MLSRHISRLLLMRVLQVHDYRQFDLHIKWLILARTGPLKRKTCFAITMHIIVYLFFISKKEAVYLITRLKICRFSLIWKTLYTFLHDNDYAKLKAWNSSGQFACTYECQIVCMLMCFRREYIVLNLECDCVNNFLCLYFR